MSQVPHGPHSAHSGELPRRRASDVVKMEELFAGQGIMATLMRERNWAATPLGPVEQWPVSLRTVIRLMLGSRHPMFLWWGPELFQFYNDAYVPSFGKGKHPLALGQKGKDCWPEIWPIIGPQIDDVMREGKPSWNEDALVPIFRNGRIEDVYWTYGYSPVYDEAGEVGGTLVICTETTSRVLSERAVRESEERLRRVVEASGTGTWEMNLSSGLVRLDQRLLSMLGLPENTTFSIPTLLLQLHREDRDALHQGIQEALSGANGGQYQAELRIPCTTGADERWLEMRGQVFYDDHGQAVRFLGTALEITERRRAAVEREFLLARERDARRAADTLAQRSAEQERLLKAVVEQMPQGLAVGEASTGRLVLGNAQIETMLRKPFVPASHTEEYRMYRGFHPDGRLYEPEEWPLARAMRTGEIVKREIITMERGDGTLATLELSASPVRNQGGEIHAGVVILDDVSERLSLEKERERLLREVEAAHNRLFSLFESAPAFVCTLRGPTHIFEMVNQQYLRLVGASRDLVGMPAKDALPEVEGQGFLTLLDDVYRSGEPYVGKNILFQADRQGTGILEDHFLTFVYQPRRDMKGVIEGIDVFGFDVSEHMQALQKAKSLTEELRQRADFEQQLIGIVSHDLRNPVSAILLGAAGILRGGELSERQTKNVVRIQLSAERANRMIRDLLDFTQARLAGGLHVQRRPTDLHELIRGVLEEVEATHAGREIRWLREGDGRGEWDPDRLGQVIQNLVTNALKYSPEGTPVRVETWQKKDQVFLAVHNEGPAIPAERLGRIFQPLQRATSELDKTGRSIGLGLYIVKQVVDAHGGQIRVTSEPQTGTTFTVQLPCDLP